MVFSYDRAQDDDDAASDVSTEEFSVGEHVLLDGKIRAKVAYFGQVEFSHDDDWIGLVFEEPIGKHSGQVSGTEYFKCQPLHGLFVRSHRLQRTDSQGHVTARVKSPYRLRPPSAARLRSPELEAEEDMFKRAEQMSDPLGYYEARAGTLRSADDELNSKLDRMVDELQDDGHDGLNFGNSTSARGLHSSRTPTPTHQRYSASSLGGRRLPAKKIVPAFGKSKPYGITQGYGELD